VSSYSAGVPTAPSPQESQGRSNSPEPRALLGPSANRGSAASKPTSPIEGKRNCRDFIRVHSCVTGALLNPHPWVHAPRCRQNCATCWQPQHTRGPMPAPCRPSYTRCGSLRRECASQTRSKGQPIAAPRPGAKGRDEHGAGVLPHAHCTSSIVLLGSPARNKRQP